MPDTRSLRQKLEAMARDKSSPNEAAVARRKLEAMGVTPEPPRPTAGRPTQQQGYRVYTSYTSNTGTTGSFARRQCGNQPFREREGGTSLVRVRGVL